MKSAIIWVVSFLNLVLVQLRLRPSGAGNRYYLFRVRAEGGSICTFQRVDVRKTDLQILGKRNAISLHQCLVDGCLISINGFDNRLEVADGVLLRGVTIQIRGDNCLVRIGRKTTFGGARIVAVGHNNNVLIGEDCLFSDHIEVWASDTHDIIDAAGGVINAPRDITIGNHVWVGAKASILKGVVVGSDSVIGFGSIITKDVPPCVVCAGSPQRILKHNTTWRRDEDR